MKTLVGVFMITSTQIGSISENIKLAIVLKEEFGVKFATQVSERFMDSFTKIIQSKQDMKENPTCNSIIVNVAALMSEFYELGWIDDHDAYLNCMTKSIKNKFSISIRAAILKALIEAAMENLRKNGLEERFLFHLEKFELEIDIQPEVMQQYHITLFNEENATYKVMTLKDLSAVRKLLVSMKFVTKKAAAHRSLGDIKNAVMHYNTRTARKSMEMLEAMGLRHSDQFTFINELVFCIAKHDYNQSEKYAEFCLHLMNGPFKQHKEKYLASLLKYLRVMLTMHVSYNFEDDDLDDKHAFMAWLGSLYNWGVLNDEVMKEIIATVLDAEEEMELLSPCIVQLMRSIGPKYEKSQPSQLEKLFQYFEANTSFETGTIRPFAFSRMIKFRKNGWQDPDEREQRRFTKEAAEKIKGQYEPHEKHPIEEVVEAAIEQKVEPKKPEREDGICKVVIHQILENESLMKSEGTVQALKNFLLQSELRVVVFIDTVLKHLKEDLRNILMSLELLSKLTKAFEESAVDFQKSLVNQVNSQISHLNQSKSLNGDTRMRFTRLAIISTDLFQRGILSNKKFVVLMLYKGIHRLPADILAHFSAKISPRIRLEGNKRLKEALLLLEKPINKSGKRLCAGIENDLKDLSSELGTLLHFKAHNSLPAQDKMSHK